MPDHQGQSITNSSGNHQTLPEEQQDGPVTASRPCATGPGNSDADSAKLSTQAEQRGGCTWCGLPVAVPPTATAKGDRDSNGTVVADAVYCCYGCRVAHAVTSEKGQEGAVRWTIVRLGLSIFFTMNLMAFTMTMWSLDVYDVQPDPFQLKLFEVFRWLSMLFGLPVLLLLGLPLVQNAVDGFKHRIYSTDLLVATGVAAAYCISVFNVLTGQSAVYFEVGAMVLVAVTLGRWMEATGKQKATAALDQLSALLPTTARLLEDESAGHAAEQLVDSRRLSAGHHIRVAAGERFPTDGLIINGRTTVDEQVFTGESTPVDRCHGDSVLAGTVNLDGDVVVKCTADFRQGSFGKLLSLMQEARTARGHYQRLADRVSMWFFPLVTAVALGTLLWHAQYSWGTAIQHSLSVLLIACPCALGLATPLAVWTTLSTAIRSQVLFRSGEAIERLAVTRSVCLDKTGTLTTGQPQVTGCCVVDSAADQPDAVLTFRRELPCNDVQYKDAQFTEACYRLALRSNHPFARCVAEFLSHQARGCDHHRTPSTRTKPFIELNENTIRTVPGCGIECQTTGHEWVRLGSLTYALTGHHSSEQHPQSQTAASVATAADNAGASLVVFSIHSDIKLVFLINETVRPETRLALKQLQDLDLSVAILTGDRRSRAERLSQELRLVESSTNDLTAQSHGHTATKPLQVLSQLTPEEKVKAVQRVQREWGSTVMVGDGINDAPALAIADIGIAMGCGADVSRDSAQVCLLANDLSRIPWAIDLAKHTRKIIRQNLFWAFGYNAAGVILAAFGWLNPALAAGLMIVSSLLVITNSLRLMAFPAPLDTSLRGEQPAKTPLESATIQPVPEPLLTTEKSDPSGDPVVQAIADDGNFSLRVNGQTTSRTAEPSGQPTTRVTNRQIGGMA